MATATLVDPIFQTQIRTDLEPLTVGRYTVTGFADEFGGPTVFQAVVSITGPDTNVVYSNVVVRNLPSIEAARRVLVANAQAAAHLAAAADVEFPAS